MTARDEVERLLAEHVLAWLHDNGSMRCRCGVVLASSDAHMAHVAQMLDEAGLLAEPPSARERRPDPDSTSLIERLAARPMPEGDGVVTYEVEGAHAPESHKTAPVSAVTGRDGARRPSGDAETATEAES